MSSSLRVWLCRIGSFRNNLSTSNSHIGKICWWLSLRSTRPCLVFVFFKISLHFDELTQVDCCQLLISEISSKTSKRCLLGLSICSVLSSCLRRHHHHSSLQFKMEKGKEKNILIIQGGNFVGGCCLCCNPKSMILKECTLKNVSRALSTFTLVDINLCVV